MTTTEGGGTAIAGLGSDLDEIKEMAREEGQVNLVIWGGYADKSWADTFTQQTGCTVNTKDGTSSDDMVSSCRPASTTACPPPAMRRSA